MLKHLYYTLLRRPVKIKQFGYTPLVIIQDGLLILSWEVENAWRITITPELGIVKTEGSLQLVPNLSGAIVLTLSAEGYGGTVSETLTLEVLPLSILTPTVAYQQNPSVQTPTLATAFEVASTAFQVAPEALQFSTTQGIIGQPKPFFIVLNTPQPTLQGIVFQPKITFNQEWIAEMKADTPRLRE
ncbi:MAG: hypothetical protein RLZZ292_3298 [Bacteroidota bacterium]|jgi:hypothetical protein